MNQFAVAQKPATTRKTKTVSRPAKRQSKALQTDAAVPKQAIATPVASVKQPDNAGAAEPVSSHNGAAELSGSQSRGLISQTPASSKAAAAQITEQPLRLIKSPISTAQAIQPLSFVGDSDQLIQVAASASPSQLAASGQQLGATVSKQLNQEYQQATQPITLAVNLDGEGTADTLAVTPLAASPLPTSLQKPASAEAPPLKPKPQSNLGQAPNNQLLASKLQKKQPPGGFVQWFKNNFLSFLNTVETKDPQLNTQAGSNPKLQLSEQQQPKQVAEQQQASQLAVQEQKQSLQQNFTQHPGQGQIQAKPVNTAVAVARFAQAPAPIVIEQSDATSDYAQADLPLSIRQKTDQLLSKSIKSRLDKASLKARQAAQQRKQDENTEQQKAQQGNADLNAQANLQQQQLVAQNRKKVAQQQQRGLDEANQTADKFDREIGGRRSEADQAISSKIQESEQNADNTLRQAEKDAEAKRLEGENKAAQEKQTLQRQQTNQSWWQRAKSAIQSAVNAVVNSIDSIFNVIRKAVKDIIDKARETAVSIINAGRNFIVNRLNQFKSWAQDAVNALLANTFPNLAASINEKIDSVVNTAVATVNLVADGAISTVNGLASVLSKALDKILSVYQGALKGAVGIVGAVVTGDFIEALKIAIRTGCEIANVNPQPIFDFFDRAGKRVSQIIKYPKKFFDSLVSAVGLGVRNFQKNIKQHLIKGLIGWLTGALSETPITLPERFNAKGIFHLVAQVLGLTYSNIRAKVVKRYPPSEKVISLVEKGVEIVALMVTKGPVALWGMVKESIGNLKQMVISAIRDFAITTVIKEAIFWLLGLLNPAGALVKILKLLFDLVMFFVNNFQQISSFVLSIYTALSDIAAGVIGKAAGAVESAMSKSLPVIIGLLASLAGLGGLGSKIQGVIKKVTKPINNVINKVVNKMIDFAKKLLGKAKTTGSKLKEKLVQWWRLKRPFTAADGKKHHLLLKGQANSAKLMMRSTEVNYEQYLNTISPANLTDEQKEQLVKAKTKAKEVDKLIATKHTYKTAKSNKDKRRKEKAKLDKKKQDKLEKLFRQLVKHSRHLVGIEKKYIPKWQPEYSGQTGANFSKGMQVVMLSKKQKGWSTGSTPTSSAHQVYDKLNLRRFPSNPKSAYYIRGHLLNEQLGGPGKWTNMTPLSVKGNANHVNQIEAAAKRRFNSGAELHRYTVTPQYISRTGASTILKALYKRIDTDPALDNTQRQEKRSTYADILKAEIYVPTALKAKLIRLKPKDGGKSFTEEKVISLAIPNPVQRNPESYVITSSAAQRITAVNLKTGDFPSLNKQMNLATGNSHYNNKTKALLQATNIRKAVLKRKIEIKRGEKGWFPSYASTEEYLEAGGGRVTHQDLTSLSDLGYIKLK